MRPLFSPHTKRARQYWSRYNKSDILRIGMSAEEGSEVNVPIVLSLGMDKGYNDLNENNATQT